MMIWKPLSGVFTSCSYSEWYWDYRELGRTGVILDVTSHHNKSSQVKSSRSPCDCTSCHSSLVCHHTPLSTHHSPPHLQYSIFNTSLSHQSVDKNRSLLALTPHTTHSLFVYCRVPVAIKHYQSRSPNSMGDAKESGDEISAKIFQ